MNRNGNVFYQSHVDVSLLGHLRDAGLISALVDIKSFRVKSYWNKPKIMLQDGWKLIPTCDPRRSMPREWVLGDTHHGQKLSFDREQGLVKLLTYIRDYAQELVLDLNNGAVVQNRIC